MVRHLLPQKGQFYKANLHCHTTVSDGKLTPEQVKEVYVENGYSIVAFTDHDVYITHPELRDEHFLPLNGFEVEINEGIDRPFSFKRTCHICFIATDPDNDVHPLWHRTLYTDIGHAPQYRDQVKFDESKPDYVREYTPECVSDMMRVGRESGFFVTYNHPHWSMETLAQYGNYHGMHAMEIYNNDCYLIGMEDYNPAVYDEMLRGGERIYCVAADDNHNSHPKDSALWDSCGGFVMIAAERLDYRCVTDALLRGDFYASRGPQISELTYDTDTRLLRVVCSDAVRVTFQTGRRNTASHFAADKGKTAINETAFTVSPEDGYVRVTVTDADGKTANTRAYFVDELMG